MSEDGKLILSFSLQDGSIASSQYLSLRSEFVHSLCIADQLGVLKSIKHIAKTLHAGSQPSPPPPHISLPQPRHTKFHQLDMEEVSATAISTEDPSPEVVSTTDSHPLENDQEELKDESHPETKHEAQPEDVSQEEKHSDSSSSCGEESCSTDTASVQAQSTGMI